MSLQSRRSLSTKAYSCGEVIASETKPFIHAVHHILKSKYCNYCLNKENESNRLKKCSKCQSMYYCDRNCQLNDWFVHKHECKIFAKHMTEIENCGLMVDWLLLLRLILVYKNYANMFTEQYSLHDGQHRCFNELMSHQNEMKRDETQTSMISSIMEILTQFSIEIKSEHLCRLYGQIRTNAYELLYNDIETVRGIHMYSIAYCVSIPISVFNHSCQPNACVINDGLNIQVRAMTAIKPNEEIFISYTEFVLPKNERKLKLSAYYFRCNCVKCKTNSDREFDYEMFDDLFTKYRALTGSNLTSVILGVKIGEELLKLNDEMCQYYNPNRCIIMFAHLIQLIDATFNYKIYPKQQFFRFASLTEENLKIIFGCYHKFYKKFSETVNRLSIEKE